MQDTPSGPSNRPNDSLGIQLALLLLGRQLGSPAGPGLANALPPGTSHGTAAGARSSIGKRKVPQGLEVLNIGAGSKVKKRSGDLKLFRYDLQDRHQICGGVISKRGAGRIASALPPTVVLRTTRRFSTDWRMELITSLTLGGVAGLGRASNVGLSSSPRSPRRQPSTPWTTTRSWRPKIQCKGMAFPLLVLHRSGGAGRC